MLLYVLKLNQNAKMPEAYGKYYAYPVITQTVGIDGLAGHIVGELGRQYFMKKDVYIDGEFSYTVHYALPEPVSESSASCLPAYSSR